MEWVCCPAAKHRKPLPLDFSTFQLCLDYFSLPVFLYFKTNFYCILKQTFTFLINTSFYDHASLFWKGFYNSSVLCEENSKALLRSLHFLIYGKLRLQKSVPTQELRTNIVLLGGASLICKMLVFPSSICCSFAFKTNRIKNDQSYTI